VGKQKFSAKVVITSSEVVHASAKKVMLRIPKIVLTKDFQKSFLKGEESIEKDLKRIN
jgi:hypothetical protein